jgi:hypothetical protein
MKKSLLIIGLLIPAFTTQAQSIAGMPWKLKYEHNEDKLPVAIFIDGVKLKEFTLSEITLVSSNGVSNYTFVINMPGFPRGTYKITGVAIDPTNGEFSEHSAIYNHKVKPRNIFNLGFFGN